jgi:hypothetical protein
VARDVTQAVVPSSMVAPDESVAPGVEVYYLVPNISTEFEIAEAWHQKHKPELDDEHFTQVMPLTMLHKSTVVYVLCRKPKRGKHGGKLRELTPQKWAEGKSWTEPVSAEEAAEDMEAYGPINCADFWQGGNRWSSKIDRAIIQEIQRHAIPYALKFQDGNACKTTFPVEVYLAHC